MFFEFVSLQVTFSMLEIYNEAVCPCNSKYNDSIQVRTTVCKWTHLLLVNYLKKLRNFGIKEKPKIIVQFC